MKAALSRPQGDLSSGRISGAAAHIFRFEWAAVWLRVPHPNQCVSVLRECHSSLNHTGVYLVKQDRMLLHLEFPWVSIAPDASPREQLRYYREYRGLLRRELGDMTGISETTILNYELGYMPIAYDKAKRLAKALEIDEKLLFDDYCRFLDYPFQLRCKELRLELGLTQVEIADKAGIARGTYGTWECAAVRPGREPFQKFTAFITSQGKEVV